MKTTVKVTCADGNHWTTGINLSFAEAKEYFMSYRHVTENFETGEETYTTVVNVELVPE